MKHLAWHQDNSARVLQHPSDEALEFTTIQYGKCVSSVTSAFTWHFRQWLLLACQQSCLADYQQFLQQGQPLVS